MLAVLVLNAHTIHIGESAQFLFAMRVITIRAVVLEAARRITPELADTRFVQLARFGDVPCLRALKTKPRGLCAVVALVRSEVAPAAPPSPSTVVGVRSVLFP